MRIVVMGSGGTGGFFGAKLARAGEDVTFVARGAHLEAIRTQGLRVKSAPEGEWVVKVPAVDTLDGLGPADFVLFCVKSFDTESAGRALALPASVLAAGGYSPRRSISTLSGRFLTSS